MFEKDISQLAKPEIKGRGFIGSGKEIIETQTYYTQPEKDWVFDDTMLLTYNNPVYIEQCKLKGITVDDSGFIPQKKLDEVNDEEDAEDEEDEDDIDDDDIEKITIKKRSPVKSSDGPPPIMKPDGPPPIMKPNGPPPIMKPSSTTPPIIKSEQKETDSVSKDSIQSILGMDTKKDSIRNALSDGVKNFDGEDIKVTADKTETNTPSTKPKLKLNIKPKE